MNKGIVRRQKGTTYRNNELKRIYVASIVLFDCITHLAFHLDTNQAEHDTLHDYRWEALWCPRYSCRGRGIKWMVD